MAVIPVYQGETAPERFRTSIYLIGATAAQSNTQWRITVLELLEAHGYDGVVFIPEPRPGMAFHRPKPNTSAYDELIADEEMKFQMSDIYLVWRGDDEGPGMTSLFQLGRILDSGRTVLGAPPKVRKTHYPRHLAQHLHIPIGDDIETAVVKALEMLGESELRDGGLRFIPPFIARTQQFKSWYKALVEAGNRLESADLRWSLRTGPGRKIAFMWLLHPKVWITKENRYKDNEVVLFRPDIAVTVLFQPAEKLEDYRIVLIKEMRSAVSQATGMVHENPGGSSWEPGVKPLICAVEEIKDETGLIIDPARLIFLGKRQIAPTLSTFMAHVFMAELQDHEMQQVIAQEGEIHGVTEDTEQAYTYWISLGEILRDPLGRVAWPDLGMILAAIFSHYFEHNEELAA